MMDCDAMLPDDMFDDPAWQSVGFAARVALLVERYKKTVEGAEFYRAKFIRAEGELLTLRRERDAPKAPDDYSF